MATNDFLLIVTPEWFEMPPLFMEFVQQYGAHNLAEQISQGSWGAINEFVEFYGLLPEGMTLDTMRIVSLGVEPEITTRAWCQFKPLVYTN